MQDNLLVKKELKEIALVCILLAAKLMDDESTIYRLTEIVLTYNENFKNNIAFREMQIMNLLKWDLRGTTVLEFLEVFLAHGMLFSKEKTEKLSELIGKDARNFADLCIQEYEFMDSDPLNLAAAIIVVIRELHNLENPWREELELITTLNKNDISENTKILFIYYKRWKKELKFSLCIIE